MDSKSQTNPLFSTELRVLHQLCLSLLLMATPLVAAPTTTVLTGTVEMIDSDSKSVQLTVGQEVPPGRLLKTAPSGNSTLSPMPEVEITLKDNASVEILVGTKEDNAVKVVAGALSYGTKSGFTGAFVIQTVGGIVSVANGGGSILVSGSSVRIATTTGQTSFSPPGRAPIIVPSGIVLGVSGTSVTLTDIANKIVSVLGLDNSVQSTRPATASDLQLASAVQAVGLQSPSTTAAPVPVSSAAPTPLLNSTANPVNISGTVNSPAE